ncbi:hypothetical protein HDK77DRAFT_453382 [Phyllosticta capitalensis]|uniref:PhoD-like phosphatase domain-containing protein n=1 Tax=Phyllosticta capitalensis TaxID=121624 RepID=A0ABR1YR53_9PEZI
MSVDPVSDTAAGALAPGDQIPPNNVGGSNGIGTGPQVISTSAGLQLQSGPLLNFKRMSSVATGRPTWHGSVLIVTTPGQQKPELLLTELGPVSGATPPTESGARRFEGFLLYEDAQKAFWRFAIDLPFLNYEARWQYHIPNLHPVLGEHAGHDVSTRAFAVPSVSQSMRILFHSCNGFSVGTDVDAWSGPALWNDVLRNHEQKPFHVMLGGGDQIYNDGVRVDGPLRAWTDISNPKKRQHYPFNEELREQCDEYYFKNYVRWYNTKPFSDANGQIPQLNVWDDHDIIDGFGSYTDHFMRCAVFRGIGGVAHKYYLLFQHHLAPPKSTFTTDDPKTVEPGTDGTPADPVQMRDTFVAEEPEDEESFIIGDSPGPYVEERSRSLYAQLGARIAFLGIDARTERTRHQVNYPETYNKIFARVEREFSTNPEIKHLVLLLGVPIAYPRLQWLENILQSPLIAPIRLLNKRFGVAGSLFNHFDGQVDILDDLDDHYTAHQHKAERKELILRLQETSKKYGVRVTILGGDVHLCALGRFYSKPTLQIPTERDHRYMVNIVSSAITNKPPPQPVANLLARRNKIHHLDSSTDETLLELFDRQPGFTPDGKDEQNVGRKSGEKNFCTMPSRNYAIIAESHDASSTSEPPSTANGSATSAGAPAFHTTNGALAPPQPPGTANGSTHAPSDAYTGSLPSTAGSEANGHVDGAAASTPNGNGTLDVPTGKKVNPRRALHAGEKGAGSRHPAASGLAPTRLGGPNGLDVTFRVEISNKDAQGHTDGYGLVVPGLEVEK